MTRSSTMSTGAASEPARSSSASSLAVFIDSNPVVWKRGPNTPCSVASLITSSVTFALRTSLPSTTFTSGTRSMYTTADIQQQHQLLNDVARLVESGAVKTTLAERYGKINADNLKRAHALIESNRARGKIVLEGF